MRNTLPRIERAVIALERLAIFVAFIGLVAALFLQVIFRFVLQSPLDFTEELSRVLIVWLVFISAATGIARAEHFVVDFIVKLFPRQLSTPIAYLVDAICVTFMIAAAWISYKTAFGGSGQTMPALQVSIIVQSLAMPVGFTLMTFHSLMIVLRRRHIGDPPQTEPERNAGDNQNRLAEPEGGL
ncbi:MAG: TRAP transporter small permease [Silicimonas sp.]